MAIEQEELKAMRESWAEMRQEADQLLEQVRRMRENFAWGSWEPYQVGIVPRRVKGRWYWRGDTVYRKERFGPGGVRYQYGDLFDVLATNEE